jgi:hypothetical protein
MTDAGQARVFDTEQDPRKSLWERVRTRKSRTHFPTRGVGILPYGRPNRHGINKPNPGAGRRPTPLTAVTAQCALSCRYASHPYTERRQPDSSRGRSRHSGTQPHTR